MQLYFYNCSDDYRRVNKTLGEALWSHNVDPLEMTDLIRPSFTVVDESNMPLTFNYAYCPDLGRYYFVTSQEGKIAGKRTIKLLVDVRKSFINGDMEVCAVRNQYATKSNIPDDKYPVDPNNVEIIAIPLDNSLFAHYGSTGYTPYRYDVISTV